jgi:sugar phosphate isomerase/epimerase
VKLSYMIATPEVAATPMSWVGESASVLGQVAQLGYGGVELQVRDPDAFDRVMFSRQVGAAGLAFTGVSTAPAVTEDGLFLTSADESVRQEAVRRLLRVIEFAAECGTHATIGRIRGFARWAPSRRVGLDWFRAALDPLIERAAALDVRIVIEPQTQSTTDMVNTIGGAIEFVDSVGSPVLAIEADSYHMSAEERSVAAALVTGERSGRLVHVQISDTNRLAPGWGHLNWADFFGTLAALDYRGWICIEALQQPDSAAVSAHSYAFAKMMIEGAHGQH